MKQTMPINRRSFVAFNIAFLATACTNFNLYKKQKKITLTVSAASSLQDAMKDILVLYQQENPNVNINYNFGSSGSLQQQIEQGAPTDIFISAAPKQMNNLQKKELLLIETRQNLLKNRVVLIVPKRVGDGMTFNNLNKADLRKISLGDPASVPAGQYGKEVLISIGLYEKVDHKLIFAKNTRQIVLYVETGNVDAGLVYKTDVIVSEKVRIVDMAPENYHSPIIYPISVIKRSKHPKEAKEFTAFLFSRKAKDIFKDCGFGLIKD
ncbi:molybdate ABC transporter substrate-binding protein [Cyanobacterium sp. uoEpiScrs1]|uniref:molybdate ABC transporter substrate-binding protein n=1 Tax=Cyanobacterium sp. uoEpiScrs1 TaxID=2976343 RepID=UPI00226A58A2|nr:molybdate ABC transporter substrate-binding protein [Cyanobacterium sp. uoEpiScrs1]